jgi:hypothetical protein
MPMVKRQRTNSDLSHAPYSAMPYLGGPVAHHSSSNPAWLNEPQSTQYSNYDPLQFRTLEPHEVPVGLAGWSRSQASSLLAGTSTSSAVSGSTPRPVLEPHYQPQSQQFGMRNSTDLYGSQSQQTPSSAPDSGISSHPSQSLLDPSIDFNDNVGRGSLSQFIDSAQPVSQALQGTTGYYDLPPSSASSLGASYLGLSGPTGMGSYSTAESSGMTKVDNNEYSVSANPFFDPTRQSYASEMRTLPEPTVSLNSALLNRSVAPAHPPQQQATGSGFSEDDFSAFKMPSNSYPTPNQSIG